MTRPITLVTGGSRGIGAATALRLAHDGHDVALTYVRDRDAADRTAEAVRAAGARCAVIKADTAQEADIERMFDEAEAQLGPLACLVNNAGVTSEIGPLAEASTANLRRVVDVNVLGVLLSCRRAAREMGARGVGAIVNVSSAAATLGSPGEYVHYAAAKAAVDTLTLGLAKELGPVGVRVNAVAPGIIDTEIHAASGAPDRAFRLSAGVPLGRPGRVDEVAGAIAWLLSADASYTTGTVIRVSGGR